MEAILINPEYNEKQKKNIQTWLDVQSTLNRGDFDAMDAYFHEDFEYENPSRPDLKGFLSWKQSPMALYNVFPPCIYTVRQITVEGDDTVWALCHHFGIHKGRYMGVEGTGNEMQIEWVSIINFKDGRITKIKSIADVLTQLIQVGVIDKSKLPIDPYR
jgi:ketosteroid isomerase-like protein